MTNKISSFTDLTSWQISHQLVVSIFSACVKLSKNDVLRNQIERSSLSITSNIAEGFGRQSPNDKKHFYVIARGSAYEVQNQLLVARGTNRITSRQFQELAKLSLDPLRLLHGLIRSLNNRPLSKPPSALKPPLPAGTARHFITVSDRYADEMPDNSDSPIIGFRIGAGFGKRSNEKANS